MSRIAIVITALTLAAAAAHAQDGPGEAYAAAAAAAAAPSAVLRFEVRNDADAARAAGAWPVRDYDPVPIYHRPKATQHRKQYPNVMGVRFADWLAAHEAASEAQEGAASVN